MSKKIFSYIQTFALLGSVALVAGCTATAQTEQTQSDVQRALQMAEEAQQTAEEALQAARAAQESADASQRCCTANEDRINRALERMQQK